MVTATGQARRVELPCWLKASFSTAGRGVRYVNSPGQAARAYDELAAAGPVLAQQPAAGTYAQVAGLLREPTASARKSPPRNGQYARLQPTDSAGQRRANKLSRISS